MFLRSAFFFFFNVVVFWAVEESRLLSVVLFCGDILGMSTKFSSSLLPSETFATRDYISIPEQIWSTK